METIGGALGDVRRSVTLLACLSFSAGALFGGVLTFVGLALVGSLIGDRGSGVAESVGAAIALAGADSRLARCQDRPADSPPGSGAMALGHAAAPGGRALRLPAWPGLYDLRSELRGLGVGRDQHRSRQPCSLASSLASRLVSAGRCRSSGWPPACVGVGGRGSWMLWPPSHGCGWDYGVSMPVGLLLCALWMSAGAAEAMVIPAATNPVAAGRAVVWQKVGGSGMLRRSSGKVRALPGTDPALGGSRIAWRTGDRVQVADANSLRPALKLAIEGVDALAVSEGWLAYRRQSGESSESLIALRLANPSRRRHLAGPRPMGQIGRPALDGSQVIFTVDTPRRSRIEVANLRNGARHTLRRSQRGAGLFNPALLHGRLLYERVNECRQQLRLGPLHSSHRDHVLKALASTVRRDPGYEGGYEHAWNMASKCHNRGFGKGGKLELGPVALGGSRVYFTEVVAGTDRARIITRRR